MPNENGGINGWRTAVISGLGVLAIMFMTLFLNSVTGTAETVAQHAVKIATLEQAMTSQKDQLDTILLELRELRSSLAKELNRSNPPGID